MNQDQVKEALLSIEDAPLDFQVIFSGKKSGKVNGLYKPETREIIIHNRNFSGDNLLIYTAIHEYAHHLHACSRGGKLSVRSHTAEFWAILHGLLEKAETLKVYKNVFADSPELAELTETIRGQYLRENGSLVKDLGMHLLRAHELCAAIGARFEDYVDRVLCIPRLAASTAIKMYQYNLNPQVGSDNMRFLTSIKNNNARIAAEQALITGKSPDSVKIAVRGGCRAVPSEPPDEEERRARLEKEKRRLERTIASLTKRLGEVEDELEMLS
ncbi:MAG: hypothetical protein LBH70_07520 [Spirochaetaceae bacterium]|jgi:hypothetical protein|nr:hypothetical protein [Spirochaetaceae bacterium]